MLRCYFVHIGCVFIFTVHFSVLIASFSNLVLIFYFQLILCLAHILLSTFFSLLTFQLKIQYKFWVFLQKYHCIHFQWKMNTTKRYIHIFCIQAHFFWYWKWKLSTNNKAKPIFEWWVSLKIENENKMHHFFLLTKQPLRERKRNKKETKQNNSY